MVRYSKVLVLGAWLAAVLSIASPASAQTDSATLSSVTCPGTGCLAVIVSATGQAAVQVTGTWSGKIVFEKTVDGTTWLQWTLVDVLGDDVTSTVANGIFTGSTEGSAEYRIRISEYWSGSAGVSYNFLQSGGGNFSASYLLKQADDTLPNAQVLGALTSGIVKNTTTGGPTPTGTLSIAAAGTDYLAPTGSGAALTDVALLAGSYANPSWILSIAWSKLTGVPTTISGYGIVDAQPLDSDLSSIALLGTAPFGRGLLTEASASTLRTTLSLVPGTDVQVADADLTSIAALTTTSFGRGLLTESSASTLRTTLSLVPGTDVQVADADLTSIAALTTTSFGRSLLTQADASAARTTLGLVIGTNVNADVNTLGYLQFPNARLDSPSADTIRVRTANGASSANMSADIFISGNYLVAGNATRLRGGGAGKLEIVNNVDGSTGIRIDVNTDNLAVLTARSTGADTAILKVKTPQASAGLFSACPAAPSEGMLCAITDSSTATWGATITGSGANHVLGYYNGTNWVVK